MFYVMRDTREEKDISFADVVDSRCINIKENVCGWMCADIQTSSIRGWEGLVIYLLFEWRWRF